MTVSVVIPSYNSFCYIKDAIESVKKQTFKDWEVIVVDDGSTDVAFSDLKKLEKENIRVYYQSNQGPAAARNLAISKARGEYILPLDADDKIEPTYIEKAVRILDQDSEVGIVYCRADKFGLVNLPWDLPDYSEGAMAIDNIIFCTSLFRKKDWETVGGFPRYARRGLEDYAFWLKIIALGRRVVRINEVLFHYRVSAVSRTTKFLGDKEGIIETYADIFRDNIEFFSKHAEDMYRFRFGKCAQCSFLPGRVRRGEGPIACLISDNIHFSDLKEVAKKYFAKKWRQLFRN